MIHPSGRSNILGESGATILPNLAPLPPTRGRGTGPIHTQANSHVSHMRATLHPTLLHPVAPSLKFHPFLMIAVAVLIATLVVAATATNSTSPATACTTDADCPGSYCMNDKAHKSPYQCHESPPTPPMGHLLYRCYQSSTGDNMVSLNSTCEVPSAYLQEGNLGRTAGTPTNNIELFRCCVTGRNDHSVRLAGQDCPAGSSSEFSLGYLYTYSPGGPNAVQLFQCYTVRHRQYTGDFVSVDPGCEGQTLVQALGWTMKNTTAVN